MHAAHIGIPEWRQEWVIDRYCGLAAQPDAGVRIRTYRKTLAVWWAVRISRYLYELPRALDPRLASIPEGRMADLSGNITTIWRWQSPYIYDDGVTIQCEDERRDV